MSTSDDLYSKILKALKEQTDEIKSDIQHINSQISNEAALTRAKISTIESYQNKLKDNIIHLERVARKNNIIIFGLEITEQNLVSAVIKKLNELMDINLCETDINDIYKLNKNKISPIKVEFVSFLKKKLIFGSVKKLKGKNIYINNDLCKEDQEKDKILRSHLKQAREKGYNAYIRKGKIIINKETFSPDQLEENGVFEIPTGLKQPSESNERRPANSAPSTPTPVLRSKQTENDFTGPKENQTPENIREKKGNKTSTQKSEFQRKATRSNSTTTTDTRGFTKSIEKK